MHQIHIKRIYDPRSDHDGLRVLVDRLWPRGVSKDKADVDEWLRAIAPSPDLRKTFNHRPERFEEFRRQYEFELDQAPEQKAAVQQVLGWLQETDVTLLYAARDPVHNHVVVLRDVLESHM